jgi:long-subunit acyl-CoA synthetase (AMP-forming)
MARNGMEWALLDLACIKLGCVTAGFEFGRFACSRELLGKYALKAIYADADASQLGLIDLGALVRAIAAEPEEQHGATPGAPTRYLPTDVTSIKFTSGSTGEPKGLCATVGSIDASLESSQAMFAHGDGDNLLIFLPLSLLQQRYWIYSALTYGHDVTVASFERAFDAALAVQPTVVMGVPGFFDAVRKRVEMDSPGNDLARRRAGIASLLGSRIRYLWTGSAPAGPDMLAFFNECEVNIFEGYGMNETCIVSKNYPGASRVGSVGKLLPNKRARIDDDGVLIIGSDFPVNTSYAYCAPGDSERIFLPGGEVRTGDLARFDEDGYLYILGRADDIVVLGNGKNVYTRSLEEKVRTHAAVGECVVYGAGRPFLVAVISPAAQPADESAIRAHIRQVNDSVAIDERIGKAVIAGESFTVENGLLTSQYKPKRKDIYRLYQADIDQLYGVRV